MNYKAIIKEVVIKELARIASLFNLSTLDDAEIDAKLPEKLKKSKIVKQIIDFYKENGNQPSPRKDIIAKYGYTDTAYIGSTFAEMQRLGIVNSTGLSHPKMDRPVKSNIRGRIGTPIGAKSDYEKIKFILGKFKTGEPKEEYKTWFINTYSEADWNDIKSLMAKYNTAKTKEEFIAVKANLKAKLASLGISTPKQGRPVSADDIDDTAAYNDTQADDEYDYNDDSTVYENQPVRKIEPSRPGRALPGIAEPPSRTAPKPDRKRRTLTPPDPDAQPNPKNEAVPTLNVKSPLEKTKNDIGGYGWDVKKGLTQTPKPPITQTNKPKVKEVSNTFNKIVKKYNDLKK